MLGFLACASGLQMELSEWEPHIFEIARTFADAAPRDLANAQLSPEEEMAARISVAAQRATRYHHTRDIARVWRAWLRRVWYAPPEPSVEDPHNMVEPRCDGRAQRKGFGRAMDEALRRAQDLLIFVPENLAGLETDQLHAVPDGPQSNRLRGQLWRAMQVAGGSKKLAGGPRPSTLLFSAGMLFGWRIRFSRLREGLLTG